MHKPVNVRILLCFSTILLPLCLLFAEKGHSDGIERRIALIIGNEAYDQSPLLNPVNDAIAMGETLNSLGFESAVETNLDWRQMNEAIDRFGEKLSRGGVGLFYYAGHGMQVFGKNYLIPVGANIRFEKEVKYKAIDAAQILAEMRNAKNPTNIVILDACRGNPFYRSFQPSAQGLAYMNTPTGTLIAYSTGPGKKASDGRGKNGVYTSELIKELREPGLRAVDIFNNVRKAVRTKTDGMQVPWESTSLEGPFYFIPQGLTMNSIVPKEPPAEPDVGWEAKIVQDPGKTWTESATGMEFAWVPGGCYRMGCALSDGCEEDELPVHEVCVDGFWVGKYEVTNEQFVIFLNDKKERGPEGESWFKTRDEDWDSRIISDNGGYGVVDEDRNRPIVVVSWYGARAFAKWMSEKNGMDIDLPAEAQWEYACRSGGKDQIYSGGDDPGSLVWYSAEQPDPEVQSWPVGTKAPNGLGVYDLSGNVWEWCRDIYKKNAYRKHTRVNPTEFFVDEYSGSGSTRVIRGGSYKYDPRRSRCANRGSHWIAGQSNDLGFRLVMQPSRLAQGHELTANNQ